MAYRRWFRPVRVASALRGIEWTVYYDYREKKTHKQRLWEVRIRHSLGADYSARDIRKLADNIMVELGFKDISKFDQNIVGARFVGDIIYGDGSWLLLDKISRTRYPNGYWGNLGYIEAGLWE